MTEAARTLRIGTRKSPLALAQAHEVAGLLEARCGLKSEIVKISTTGDEIQSRPLLEIGGKGLFTKEIEEALYKGDIDLAVHSMKDVPTVLPEGLEISTILEREDPRDVFIGRDAAHPKDLPQGATVGTASLRRGSQVKAFRPDLKVEVLRGSVQTRLKKLEEGVVDGTFLARAGLNRLDMAHIGTVMEAHEFLPAVAQGAIGIEIRSDDSQTRAALDELHHADSAACVAAERAFLAVLDGSCRTPIAGYAELSGDMMQLRGLVLTPHGDQKWAIERKGPASDPVRLGREAGEALRRDIESRGIDLATALQV